MSFSYILTNHARDRIKERFPQVYSEYPDLNGVHTKEAHAALRSLLSVCNEDKTVLNDTSHMVYMYEKYGYDTEYKFMLHDISGMELVLCKERSGRHFRVVTVIESKSTTRNKFKKFKTKDTRQKEKLLNTYDMLSKQYETISKLNSVVTPSYLDDLKLSLSYLIESKDQLALLLDNYIDCKNMYAVLFENNLYLVQYEKEYKVLTERIVYLSKEVEINNLSSKSPTLNMINSAKTFDGVCEQIKVSKSRKIKEISVDGITRTFLSISNDKHLLLSEVPNYKYI